MQIIKEKIRESTRLTLGNTTETVLTGITSKYR